MELNEACVRFVRWLDDRVLRAARGDDDLQLAVEPAGKLWLGRLAPEARVQAQALGERGERLEPCAVGLVVQPTSLPITFEATVRCRVWRRIQRGDWQKSDVVSITVPISFGASANEASFGADQLAAELATAAGEAGLVAEVRVERTQHVSGRTELAITLVNVSPDEHPRIHDTNLYEASLEVRGLATEPFLLEALPDSFRYDRAVPAYGINCAVDVAGQKLSTRDSVAVERGRPAYWSVTSPEPDLTFETLAGEPLPSLEALVGAFEQWGTTAWSAATLDRRAAAERWSAEMRTEAERGAEDYQRELARMRAGLDLLRSHQQVGHAFRMMNASMKRSSRGRYDRWRPFQVGFLLANITCLTDPSQSETADIVWFATGGGKTETYLGIVVTAAFYDRLRGKVAGITAWNRFPLRMLSLQQTQRFADALGAAELVRLDEGVGGEPFSVGFLVGGSATPNRFKPNPKEGEEDLDTASGKFIVLLRCPFCHSTGVSTRANHALWTLEHRCANADCVWGNRPLPFYIVDDEIYRFLPTVVIGTLDKAASISVQSSMRGFLTAPVAQCGQSGHGFTYATRSTHRNGCLVPDCEAQNGNLPQAMELFAPTMRLQDELHLLKDSLGAVDAHYESLLDALQEQLSGRRAKVLGSSATLSGYEKQVAVLYGRDGRVFPAAGPKATEGFWTSESDELARRFVALAPRGVTVEYALDRTVEVLQRAVRRLVAFPADVCREAGVDEALAPELVSLYGVDVVYGNTIRDLDATVRSFETQIAVSGALNSATLTGRTPFEEVKRALDRLDSPEPNFEDRIHLIAASAMMSHGVDIDRLNVMAIVGLPLTTAEFIQTSARVGRRYPGLVFVLPKMARERDAGVFRSFEHFVKQGDRFVEPVPIGRRSRRVLERTIPGLFFARLLHVHEPASGGALTTIDTLRRYVSRGGMTAAAETKAIVDLLGFDGEMDAELRDDVARWCADFFSNLNAPPTGARFPNELARARPMMSLRDVEEQVPIFGLEGGGRR